MSACLARLMDREKYLLAEMVYYHPPAELANRDFSADPLPLGELIDLIPWCESGGANPKGADGSDAAFMRRSQQRLKRLYDAHPKLHDLRLTGYINDNAGRFATTSGVQRSGLVAMSFRDGEGNGVVVFSGCETNAFRPMLKDYAGCFIAMLGAVTTQHRLALRFYDERMADVTGERGVIGHSKGGNLATYVFINRLAEPLQAYCINAQPYCWWITSDEQRAALKSERYEFIVHEGDVVHHTGYASYVSRVVRVNPYLNLRQLISIHGFNHMQFDSAGNLEGNRILRTTRRSVASRLFGDYLEERPPTHDEVIRHFQTLMTWDMEPARLMGIALEELCIATHANTAALMLRVVGSEQDTLYVYQAKGDGAQLLRDYRLRVAKGDELARVVASGLPVYAAKPERYEQHFAPLGNALGWRVASACAIPIGDESMPWIGALELLCKDDRLTAEDMKLGVELASLMMRLSRRLLNADRRGAELLMELRRGGEPLLLLERHALKDVRYDFDSQRAACMRLFGEGRLADDEALIFDGWVLLPEDRTLLRNWRRKGVALVSRDESRPQKARANRRGAARDSLSPEAAAELLGFPGKTVEWLQSKAWDEPFSPESDEAETIRARVALCLTRRPPLIVCDLTGCSPQTARELRAYLRLLCYDKLATALTLSPAVDERR